jgi:aspartyl-tRNA(Asn)/glutamyl-tRNA(Gln) amidotransferase subunit C
MAPFKTSSFFVNTYCSPTMFYICQMKVNDELIDKLANLARLEFNSEEKEEIKKDLEQMIGFIDKLNELDTTGVEPLLHMTENVNILREDEVTGTISREDALKNAPLHDDQFFKVPKVIKNN